MATGVTETMTGIRSVKKTGAARRITEGTTTEARTGIGVALTFSAWIGTP